MEEKETLATIIDEQLEEMCCPECGGKNLFFDGSNIICLDCE